MNLLFTSVSLFLVQYVFDLVLRPKKFNSSAFIVQSLSVVYIWTDENTYIFCFIKEELGSIYSLLGGLENILPLALIPLGKKTTFGRGFVHI